MIVNLLIGEFNPVKLILLIKFICTQGAIDRQGLTIIIFLMVFLSFSVCLCDLVIFCSSTLHLFSHYHLCIYSRVLLHGYHSNHLNLVMHKISAILTLLSTSFHFWYYNLYLFILCILTTYCSFLVFWI